MSRFQLIATGLGETINQVPVADGSGGFSWSANPGTMTIGGAITGGVTNNAVLQVDGTGKLANGPLVSSLAGLGSANVFTAPADSSVPLRVARHSGTQSADLFQALPDGSSGVGIRATGQMYVDSLDTTQNQLLIQVPAYSDASISAVKIIDPSGNTNAAPLLEIAHHGNNATGNQSYALAIHNYPTADSALVIHQYSGLDPAIWIDQCSNAASIRVKQAENPTLAPGTHGNGAMFELYGYNSVVSRAVGVVTGTNTLSDTTTPAAFVSTDVGKPITVAAVVTTIASVVSATQVTTAGAIVNNSGVTYSYSPYSTVAQSLALNAPADGSTANPPTLQVQHPAGLQITTTQSTPSQPLMAFTMPAGGTSSATVVRVTQNAAAIGFVVAQNGANVGLQVNCASGQTGFYGLFVNGYSHGAQITTNATPTGASQITLQVTRNNTAAGIAMQIVNKGTGNTQEWKIGSTPTMAMLFSGLGSLVIGQGAALANAATDGFLYLPTVAGTPSGVPTAFTGSAAVVYDATNNFLYVYNGGWKKSTVYA